MSVQKEQLQCHTFGEGFYEKDEKNLITSLITLLICFTMLVGTTFAWFTDTVSNTGNKIQAGTLDIDLLLKGDDGNYTSLEDVTTPVFDYDKWEPGYSNGEVFEIVNKGNLALKYTLQIAMANGTLNANTEGHSLADAIDVYFKENASDITMPTSFEAVKADDSGFVKVGTLADIITSTQADGFAHGVLLPEESKRSNSAELPSKYATESRNEKTFVAVVLHMQEEAGNEYQGMSLGASFDIRLLATQIEYEKDGFGSNQYDLNADGTPDNSSWTMPTVDRIVDVSETSDTIIDASTVKVTIPKESLDGTIQKIQLHVEPDEKAPVFTVKDSEGVTGYEVELINAETKQPIAVQETKNPIKVELYIGYLDLIEFYHRDTKLTKVEKLSDVDKNGEFYYDSNTGFVTYMTKTFSPFTALHWFGGGNGSKGHPYIIETAGHFKAINHDGKYFELVNDISLVQNDSSQYTTSDINLTQTDKMYVIAKKISNGEFDGRGHKITLNNTFEDTDSGDGNYKKIPHVFGDVLNSNIYNVDVEINGSGNVVYWSVNSTYKNIDLFGSIQMAYKNMAAYVHYPHFNITMENCDNYATIINNGKNNKANESYTAIYVGVNSNNYYSNEENDLFTFKDCDNYGSLVAGQVGMFQANTGYAKDAGKPSTRISISNCKNYGLIKSIKDYSYENNYETGSYCYNYVTADTWDKVSSFQVSYDGGVNFLKSSDGWYKPENQTSLIGEGGQFINEVDE